MAYTTYTSFVAALHALSVTDVTRSFAYPPAQLNTSGLPTKYIRLNTTGNVLSTFDGGVGLRTGVADVVIVVMPTEQSNPAAIYTLLTATMDNLTAALEAATLSIGLDSWSLAASIEGIGNTDYYVVTATVEASG